MMTSSAFSPRNRPIPPVSTRVKARPRHSASAVTRSRVTPGRSWTMAMRRPTIRLKSADFPTFGRPTLPEEREKVQLGYRPALDGLRGVAILAVMVTHSQLVTGWAGDVGVDIFFVLSGFLITSLLIEEWNRFSSISLWRFYARRALRLLPALMVMLAVVVIWHCLI